MNELVIALQTNSKKHLYEQIYDYIVNEIKEGKLLVDEKLPSTRFLAEYLQISRSTVELAYEQLVSEGYIESRPYKGYFVCRIDGLLVMEQRTDSFQSNPEYQGNSSKIEQRYQYDFSPNGIEINGFPFSIWKTLQKNSLLENERKLFSMGNPKGEPELRYAISRYLHASRGVKCNPDQIIVGAGNDYLLMLLEKIMGTNHIIALENPSYQRAYRIFCSCGYPIRALSVDQNGMVLEELVKSDATIAYVMPAHQFPTGVIMPIGRRMELLRWANEQEGRYIIEDDYDSEFRYRGKPIPALQSDDQNGKVIYIGTFSKSIAPAIRVSYMVLPEDLLECYREKAFFYSSTVSRIDQVTLTAFLEKGYFERHLNKMRKCYKVKHDLVVQLLKGLKPLFTISGENAGLHIVLHYHGKKKLEELIQKALELHIRVYAMNEFMLVDSIVETAHNSIILGYASLEEQQIRDGVAVLLQAWKE